MKKFRKILKLSTFALGVGMLLSILLIPVLAPVFPVSADFNDSAALNVWDGSTVTPGSAGLPFWPMSSKTVPCWPVLHEHASAMDIIASNHIPMTANSNPFTASRAPMTSSSQPGPAPSGDMQKVFSDANTASNKFNIITFDSLGSSSDCKQAGLIIQYPFGSTSWYGSFVSSANSSGYQYVDFTAKVDPSGTIQFSGPLSHYTDQFNGAGSLTNPPPRQNYGPQKINAWSPSVISGGGTGSGGGNSCPADGNMSEVQSQAQEDACVNHYKGQAFFANQETIVFAGGIFKATKWGGDSLASYVLTDPGTDKDWLKCGKSVIVFEWSVGGQASGSLSITKLSSFKNSMDTLGAGGTLNVDLHNINCHKGGDPTKGNDAGGYKNSFDLNTQYLNVVADYNPGDNSVSTKFTDGGGNEKQVLGVYTYAPPAVQYTLQTGGSGCQDNNARPYFTFDRILTDVNLNQGDYVTGVWHMNQTGSCTSFTDVNIRALIGAKSQKAPTPATPGGSTTPQKQDCESSAGSMGWILCPLINGLADAVNGVYTNFIVPMLQTPALSSSSAQGKSIFTAWASFRVFGNIFLVVVVLIVVFGESIGGGMIDAYTVKKVLPRILAAAIMINLSYYAVALVIDFANIVGNGLRLLLTGAFGLQGNDFTINSVSGGGQGAFLGISTIGIGVVLAAADGPAIALAVIWILFTLLPMLLFLFLAIMAVLALRLGLIYALVLASPIAFALWVLPNTEKYFKKWWEMLVTTAMVFPIISGLFGLSMVLAQTTLWAAGGKGAIGGAVAFILSLIIVVMPLVLIPFAFKIAGGVLGRAYELANGARSKGNGWLKGRAEKRKEKMAEGKFFNPAGRIGRSALGRSLNENLERNALRGEAGAGSRFALTRAQRERRRTNLTTTARDKAGQHASEGAKAINAAYGGDENGTEAGVILQHRGEAAARQYLQNARDKNGNTYSPQHIEELLSRARRLQGTMSREAFTLASAESFLSSGTVRKDANVTAMQWIHEATGGDRSAGINAMLRVAETAKAAGRGDLFSSSPVANIAAYERVINMGQPGNTDTADAITQTLLVEAKKTRSPGELATLKGDGIERMAPLIAQDVATAQQAVWTTPQYAAEQAAAQSVMATRQIEAQAARAEQEAIENVNTGGEATPGMQVLIENTRKARREATEQRQEAERIHSVQQQKLEGTAEHLSLMHEAARAAAVHDILAQVPGGKSEAYADGALAAVVTQRDSAGNVVGQQTVQEIIGSSRGVAAFQREHREYTAESAQQAGAAAAASIAGNPGQIPPVVGP